MDTYQIVRTEHLNHNGKLFGGYMLLWMDEQAWITATRDFPDSRLVTRSMDKIDFSNAVIPGSILRFHILPERIGKSSISYEVHVYADEPGPGPEQLVFSNKITFVNLDSYGKSTPLPSTERPLKSER